MSEYAEELYEDHLDFDLDDDLYEDDVEDVDDRAAEVSSIVAQWERENGIELTDADFNEMGIRVAVGIDPDEAFAATDQGQREADFADLVDRIETVENRALTETEIDRLAQRDELAQLRGETDIDPSEALYDLDSSEGIATYIGERLSVPQEREEASAVQLDADGEEVPSFNVEVRNERVAAIDAAMSGEAVSVHDSTYDLESDDE